MATLSFGKRFGFEPVNVPLQLDSMNHALRTELYNFYYIFFYTPWNSARDYNKDNHSLFHLALWMKALKRNANDFEGAKIIYSIRHFIDNEKSYLVYEFMEQLIETAALHKNKYDDAPFFEVSKMIEFLNQRLIENNSGYTMVNGYFIPVTNAEEIAEIKKVDSNSLQYGLQNVQAHLKNAIDLLSKKPEPDYANCIKESISMVEAICITIEPSEDTLGAALKRIEKSGVIEMHSALKEGFLKIYGYVSDGDGIRHASKIDEARNLGIEDARFFLVSCSAFTNYLIEKANKAGSIFKN